MFTLFKMNCRCVIGIKSPGWFLFIRLGVSKLPYTFIVSVSSLFIDILKWLFSNIYTAVELGKHLHIFFTHHKFLLQAYFSHVKYALVSRWVGERVQGFASRLADSQASTEERPSVQCKHTPRWELPSLKQHLQEARITSWERCWRAVRDMRMMDYLTHKIVVTCWHKVQVVSAIKYHLSWLLQWNVLFCL